MGRVLTVTCLQINPGHNSRSQCFTTIYADDVADFIPISKIRSVFRKSCAAALTHFPNLLVSTHNNYQAFCIMLWLGII